MHPPPSMIVFTVLSGLGLGMIAAIGLGFGAEGPGFAWLSVIACLAVTGLGGLASLGHLARPDRAWRAFSQWRSSWLSREACLMVITLAVFALYALIWLASGTRVAVFGWLAAILALATVYATAMIYHQLRTVPQWSATPTPYLFLAMSLSGGILAVHALSMMSGAAGTSIFYLIVVILAAAVAIWWQATAQDIRRGSTGSSMETATGLGRIGKVRLLEPPHTGSNYLLKEMAYHVGRKRAAEIRRLAAVLGFLLPLILLGLGGSVGPLVMLAVLSHVMGLLALRWLFFAEAQHVQALYYGMK